MEKVFHKRKHWSSFQLITTGFMLVILVGAILLMLPIASKEGVVTPFHEALFTSTSAVCVTGLVVKDTGTYWSYFGQTIILILIEIGGLGVVTIAVAFAMFSGKKISLMQRSTLKDAISAPKVGGIVRLTQFILKGTLIVELIGAFLMMPTFIKGYGIKGIWMAVFHSISAFCNAGFDILGSESNKFVSLTGYSTNWMINITIMGLIIVGGIGFLTWEDIYVHKFNFHKYRMQSKVILSTTLFLIVVPAAFFYVNDFKYLPGNDRILASLFQSVTPRTAGFNTVDLNEMTSSSKAIMVLLMLIGGSPGSTAGGMKTTTFALLFTNMIATFSRHRDVHLFKRRISEETIKNASTIGVMYFVLCFTGAILISVKETLPLSTCLFETASAVGTVGLTLGITTSLSVSSQLILIFLMYLGRVGGLTLIYAVASSVHEEARLPQEKITVG